MAEPRLDDARAPQVLVIDDEDLVRDTVADFLADEGYRVLLAADGGEALRMLSSVSTRPDLIILDCRMPGLEGFGFGERQARDPALASIPVIVVTAAPGPSSGAAAVLRKPVRLAQLARAIDAVLASAPSPASGGT